MIFTKWRVEDLSDKSAEWTNRRNGLDFGFSMDPAALSVSHYDRMRKIIYIYDELYETGLTNDVLAQRVKAKVGNDLVICDSAEPESIAELQQSRVNAKGAQKGKDSVNFGIQWLQQREVVIDKSCVNAQKEWSFYHWNTDAGGNALRVPAEKNDHMIDATRYAYEAESRKQYAAPGPSSSIVFDRCPLISTPASAMAATACGFSPCFRFRLNTPRSYPL